jgi:hypothetical protein
LNNGGFLAVARLFVVPRRRHYSVEDKIRIALEGPRGEQSGGTQPPTVNNLTNVLLIKISHC